MRMQLPQRMADASKASTLITWGALFTALEGSFTAYTRIQCYHELGGACITHNPAPVSQLVLLSAFKAQHAQSVTVDGGAHSGSPAGMHSIATCYVHNWFDRLAHPAWAAQPMLTFCIVLYNLGSGPQQLPPTRRAVQQ